LEFLGFPWISSTESSDINGLRGIFRGNYFVGLLAPKAERTPAVEVNRKGGIVHGASLVQFPIISNHLSAESAKPPLG
jgi:hypothetical protein